MTNERTINIQTSCHDCVFARFEDDKQSGCKLNRLEKFEDKYDIDYSMDDSNVFAAVIPKLCMAKRDKEWAKDKDDVVAHVKKEMAISCDFIIVEDILKEGDFDSKLKDLNTTLESAVVLQKQKPKSVVVVVGSKVVKDNMQTYLENVKKVCEEYDVKYALVSCYEDTDVIERLIDIGVNKSKSAYYSYSVTGCIFMDDIISRLNQTIVDEVTPVSIIKPYLSYQPVIQTYLHKIVNGNNGGYIVDKIEHLAKEQDYHKSIHSWKDLL